MHQSQSDACFLIYRFNNSCVKLLPIITKRGRSLLLRRQSNGTGTLLDYRARISDGELTFMLIDRHVTKVIAGRFGPRFREALIGNHVGCIEQMGLAAQAAKEHFD